MIMKIVPIMDHRVPVMVADEAEVVIEAITAMIEMAAIGRVSIKVVVAEGVAGGKKEEVVDVMEEGCLFYYFKLYSQQFLTVIMIIDQGKIVEAVGMNQAPLIKIGQNHCPLMNVWKKNFLEIVVQALTSINMKIFQLKQLVKIYPPILIQ